jgi:Fe-S-cluster containining protein
MILLLRNEVRRISQKTSRNFDEFAERTEGLEPYVYLMRKTSDGKCTFLKDNVCTIYSIRPLVCRFYPFRLDDLGNQKYIFDYTEECLGVGSGPQLKRDFFNKLYVEFMESMRQNFL